jgi:hypothetical protein
MTRINTLHSAAPSLMVSSESKITNIGELQQATPEALTKAVADIIAGQGFLAERWIVEPLAGADQQTGESHFKDLGEGIKVEANLTGGGCELDWTTNDTGHRLITPHINLDENALFGVQKERDTSALVVYYDHNGHKTIDRFTPGKGVVVKK